MKIINTKENNGIELNKFINNVLLNLNIKVKEVEFELTSNDGKILNDKAVNKIKFKVKRKWKNLI